MACAVIRLPSFDRQAKKALKPFPRSVPHVDAAIDGLSLSPHSGDRYPGFGPVEVRKARIGLPEYDISPRKGLRVLFLFLPTKDKVVPLACYLKRDFGSEHAVRQLVKDSLKQIEQELSCR
ncbi:MAG: hypothetical protein ACYCYR_09505 [Desulfobulbaceae bacterium]|jgi:hypothetical protein